MTPPVNPDSHDQPNAPEAPPVLSGQRRALVEALRRKGEAKSERVVGMYLEAMRAIDRNDGVESMHVAGYELREFMNALPGMLDLPRADHQQLSGKIQTLAANWEARVVRSSCFKNDWTGEIDEHLRAILVEVEALIAWRKDNYSSRQEEAASILHSLTPSTTPRRPQPQELRVKEWSALLRYFNATTHHESAAERVKLLSQVDRLETFLLEHLEPKPFADQDEIDRLIRKVEG